LLEGAGPRHLLDRIFLKAFESHDKDIEGKGSKLRSLVAWLCPASSIRLTTLVEGQDKAIAVAPNDWTTIPDQDLLIRVACASRSLYPLRADDGELIGRIAIDSSRYLSARVLSFSVAWQAEICVVLPVLRVLVKITMMLAASKPRQLGR
jgi:hypothetical protein